jgi:hypothetical protein
VPLETCGVFYAEKHAEKSWQQNGKSRLFVRYSKFFATSSNTPLQKITIRNETMESADR